MGRKHYRARQYLYLCAAGLITAALAGCAQFKTVLAEHESRAHLQQVQLFTRQGDFRNALRENERLLALHPQSPPADAALFSMGLIHADQANPEKDYRKAQGFFTQLVKDFPQSPFAEESQVWSGILEKEVVTGWERRSHLQQMQHFTRQGDFEGAMRESRRVLALSPQNPPGDAALFSMGQLHADQANPAKDYRKAQSSFAQLVKDFPESPFAEIGRVWAEILEKEMVGHEGRAYLQRMQLLVSQGDFENALQENQKILALSPKSPLGDAALFSMGLLYAHFSNPKMDQKKALSFFVQLARDFPQSPLAEGARIWIGTLESEIANQQGRAYQQRMQLLIRRGDFETALRESQKVLALSPKSPPGDAALYHMGLIHLHSANPKMDHKKALAVFTRLKKDFPGSTYLEEAKIWIGVLEILEHALQIDIKIDEQKKELRK